MVPPRLSPDDLRARLLSDSGRPEEQAELVRDHLLQDREPWSTRLLLEILERRPPEVLVYQVIRSLGHRRDPALLDPVLPYLRHPRARIYTTALKAILRMDPERGLKVVTVLVGRQSDSMRLATLLTLSKAAPSALAGVLDPLCRGPTPDARRTALYVLTRSRIPEAARIAIDLLPVETDPKLLEGLGRFLRKAMTRADLAHLDRVRHETSVGDRPNPSRLALMDRIRQLARERLERAADLATDVTHIQPPDSIQQVIADAEASAREPLEVDESAEIETSPLLQGPDEDEDEPTGTDVGGLAGGGWGGLAPPGSRSRPGSPAARTGPGRTPPPEGTPSNGRASLHGSGEPPGADAGSAGPVPVQTRTPPTRSAGRPSPAGGTAAPVPAMPPDPSAGPPGADAMYYHGVAAVGLLCALIIALLSFTDPATPDRPLGPGPEEVGGLEVHSIGRRGDPVEVVGTLINHDAAQRYLVLKLDRPVVVTVHLPGRWPDLELVPGRRYRVEGILRLIQGEQLLVVEGSRIEAHAAPES